MLEGLVGLAAEVREGHLGHFLADQAQLQLDLATVTTFAGLDVPLALLAPAVADRTQRRDQLIGFAVEGDGFPILPPVETDELINKPWTRGPRIFEIFRPS